MAIKEIFPTKILVEDIERSDDWTNELKSIVWSVFAEEQAKGRTFAEIANDSLPLLTEENIEKFPILNEVREIFVKGFHSLASSFDNYEEHSKHFGLTEEGIRSKVSKETGRLPFMKKGDFKEVHHHLGVQAFGILYLDDVQNEKEGGELVLRDPSFNSNLGYAVPQRHKIGTKKNRLVVAPAHVWHEVTEFTGEERTAIVINLNAV